eukprot:scaffold64965_cov79-Cyclotella_meneghiniana.AAC.18
MAVLILIVVEGLARARGQRVSHPETCDLVVGWSNDGSVEQRSGIIGSHARRQVADEKGDAFISVYIAEECNVALVLIPYSGLDKLRSGKI